MNTRYFIINNSEWGNKSTTRRSSHTCIVHTLHIAFRLTATEGRTVREAVNMVGCLARFRFGSVRKKTSTQVAICSIQEQLVLLQEREKQFKDKMAQQLAMARRNIRLNEAG